MSKIPSIRSTLVAIAASSLLHAGPLLAATPQPLGVNVSDFQAEVDWQAVAGADLGFVYVKATAGSDERSPAFAAQYDGAYYAGLLRGAYHFARPDRSSGRAQADFFVDNGGDWTADGQTLPGVLDLEYNPTGATCYDLSAADMVGWIHDFADQYRARTGRSVVIYTSADWWNSCTGSATDFAAENPLWVAEYGTDRPTLPAGFTTYSFWQFVPTAPVGGIVGSVDLSTFNGDAEQLLALAKGSP